MAYELEVPVGRAVLWPAFTDPESMARAVPGLTVDAVQPVDPTGAPAGVSADVVAGRLRLKVGAGTVTYRGTATIADADPAEGTLDIAIDVAQARGSGALAGYLRVKLTPAEAGTVVSVVPDLEVSGRVAEFRPEDLREAVKALASSWVTALAARVNGAGATAPAAEAAEEPAPEAQPEPEAGTEAASVVVAAAEEPESEATESEAAESEAAEPEAAEPEPAEREATAESEPDVVVPESEAEISPEPKPEMKPEVVAELEAVTAQSEPEIARESEPEPDPEPESASDRPAPLLDDSLSEDPLASVWRGEYEKNPWLPLVAALTVLMILRRRRRRHRPMS